MSLEPNALQLRAKILGASIRDARLKANKSIEESAQFLGVQKEELEKFETGEKAISLPELELISYSLNIPLEHFWERESVSSGDGHKDLAKAKALIQLRHRMVGAMLRQARLDAGLAMEDLAQQLDMTVSQIEAYELGIESLPVPLLESISGTLNRSIREFQDQNGPVGIWNLQQQALRDFLALPLELQTFLSKPINRPYLDLAMRLSEMSVDRLRAVAEGLLEITY